MQSVRFFKLQNSNTEQLIWSLKLLQNAPNWVSIFKLFPEGNTPGHPFEGEGGGGGEGRLTVMIFPYFRPW